MQQGSIADLEAKHSVIKLVPEGGEIVQESGLLHGIALDHGVHEPQGTQHDVTLPVPQPYTYADKEQPQANLQEEQFVATHRYIFLSLFLPLCSWAR